MIVWVVAWTLRLMEVKPARHSRQALGFMERGLRLHQTLIYPDRPKEITP